MTRWIHEYWAPDPYNQNVQSYFRIRANFSWDQMMDESPQRNSANIEHIKSIKVGEPGQEDRLNEEGNPIVGTWWKHVENENIYEVTGFRKTKFSGGDWVLTVDYAPVHRWEDPDYDEVPFGTDLQRFKERFK